MKGFTLIELLVTITISLVITGGVVVNYNAYTQTQTLKQAAKTLINDFRFIQAKANNGEKPTICTTLTGWDITFLVDSYSYQPNCGGVPAGTATTITLPSGITISPPPAVTTITLKSLSQGADLTSEVSISLVGLDKTYLLEISPGGDISDLGIQ